MQQLKLLQNADFPKTIYKQACMVINMLTRWFNFEFGVPSHLNPVSLQPIAMLCIHVHLKVHFVHSDGGAI